LAQLLFPLRLTQWIAWRAVVQSLLAIVTGTLVIGDAILIFFSFCNVQLQISWFNANATENLEEDGFPAKCTHIELTETHHTPTGTT
jgi:hypothetical protein